MGKGYFEYTSLEQLDSFDPVIRHVDSNWLPNLYILLLPFCVVAVALYTEVAFPGSIMHVKTWHLPVEVMAS